VRFFPLKCVVTLQIWTKITGTLREDDLDTVMGTDRSVQWTNRQLTKRPALCEISAGSTTSLAVYEGGTRNVLTFWRLNYFFLILAHSVYKM